MTGRAKRIERLAQEAAEALRQEGWPVQPYNQETGTWQIGDALLSHDGLIDFADWAPEKALNRGAGAGTDEHRCFRGSLGAVEALECIRAVMGTVIVKKADETSAAAFRLIRAILDKAPRAGNG